MLNAIAALPRRSSMYPLNALTRAMWPVLALTRPRQAGPRSRFRSEPSVPLTGSERKKCGSPASARSRAVSAAALTRLLRLYPEPSATLNESPASP